MPRGGQGKIPDSDFMRLWEEEGPTKLMWPELVHVIGENEVEFRGAIIRI